MQDLAALAPPDLDMPPGYELTNGAYVSRDRIHSISVGEQELDAGIVAAYEATYEQRHGGGFMEVQILQFATPDAVDLDLTIANSTIDRIVADSDFAEDNLILLDPDLISTVHSGIVLERDDDDRVFPVCAVAYANGLISIRAIWHALERVNDIAMRSAPQGANRAALAAIERLQMHASGLDIPGVDSSLKELVPVFVPEANFENYLHRASRYSQADNNEAAQGFRSCYRRGVTEPWVEQGISRKLIAVDVMKFDSPEAAGNAVSTKSGLLATWMLEHTFIPVERTLQAALLYAYEHASGTWNGALFQAIGDLVWCVDVWGYATMDETESIASLISLRLISATEDKQHPIYLGPEFNTDA